MSHFSINRVVLIGRLTRDPELRALPSGTSVCSLRIACNSSRKDSDGEFVERPSFFDVSVYGASAESVSRYTSKGSRVGLDGRLEWREWETAEQQKRQAVDIVADTVQFLDGPGDRVDRDAPGAGGFGGGASDGEDAREPVGVGAALDEDDLGF
jgi:single-strand DNA-binding protein